MQDADTTPTGTPIDTSRDTTITVAEAADRLGVTQDAVRKRLQRGTLPGIKTGQTWDVIETDDLRSETSTGTPAGQDTTAGHPGHVPDATDNDLVEQLRTEVEYLRVELSKRSQELATERERSDILHREALDRLVALTATIEGTGGNASEPLGDDPHDQARSHRVKGSIDSGTMWARLWRRIAGER